jgi:hypothetical protein
MRRRRCLITSLGTAALVAGTVAAPALGGVESPFAVDSVQSSAPTSSAPAFLGSPDARDAARAATATPAPPFLGSPDARDAAAGTTTRNVIVLPSATDTAPAPSSSGFEWSDAAIGGGIVLLLTMVGGGAAFTIRRHQRHGAATVPLTH